MKKLLSLILCGAMLLTLTACDSKGNSSDNSIVQPFDPVPVPEGGWTMEELAKTICINGKNVSSPFTVESLGSEYSVKYDRSYPYLVYNKKQIALLKFDEEATEKDDRQKNLFAIITLESLQNPNLLSINGVKFGSTREEALKAFGVPTVGETNAWVYRGEGKGEYENFLAIWFDQNDKVEMLAFYRN